MLHNPSQALPFYHVAGKNFRHTGGFSLLYSNSCWITRAVRIEPIAIGWTTPRKQRSGAKLLLPTSTHPISNQGPLILGDGPSDLQEQLIMRILAHRTIDKLDPTARSLQFFQQEHLMHILACQPIWSGDEHQV